MIAVQCPRCGGTAQIESGKSAMCPCCALELTAPPPPDEEPFGQDVQFAPPPVQAAPERVSPEKPAAPPAPQVQDAGAFVRQMQDPAAAFSDDADETYARKKRRSWRFMNVFFLAIQSVLTAIGMFADAINNEDLFGMMIMGLKMM